MSVLVSKLKHLLSRHFLDLPDDLASDQTRQLQVDWCLGSDFKLVALMLGHGGSGCKNGCVFCDWRRGEDRLGQDRSTDLVEKLNGWAHEYLAPLLQAQKQVRVRSLPCRRQFEDG